MLDNLPRHHHRTARVEAPWRRCYDRPTSRDRVTLPGGPMLTTEITRDSLRTAIPALDGTVRLSGLDGPVDVVRDSLGIPHVRATSTHDAFFAQGFVTAQDRLWHMEYDRRRAMGRWAEFVGPSGVDQDRLMRKFGL